MNHLDLFSGIGGFALAAEWCGITTIGFSEIDPYASEVLRKHWPSIKNYGDIRTITRTTIPHQVDLITGGFPCQPFSTAGKQRGRDDPRDLWPEMFRVIKEFRPRWVIGENVAGFIKMELDRTLTDLENEGYTVRAFIIPACAVGAPHRRDRVWIVAHAGRGDSGRAEEPKESSNNFTRCGSETATHTEHARFNATEESAGVAQGNDANPPWAQTIEQLARRAGASTIAHTTSEQVHPLSKSGILAQHCDDHLPAANAHGGRSQEQQLSAERNQQCDQPATDAQGAGLPGSHNGSGEEQLWRGYPRDHWRNTNWLEAATLLCRVGNGVPNRTHRIKALGNAIVPQVAYEIIHAISCLTPDNSEHSNRLKEANES